MKPETARKHFTDPFRYWHPVTNNNVQKLKVLLVALLVESLLLAKVHRQILVASNQQNKRYYFAFRRVFFLILILIFFYFSIANTLNGLTLPQLNCFGSGFLFD